MPIPNAPGCATRGWRGNFCGCRIPRATACHHRTITHLSRFSGRVATAAAILHTRVTVSHRLRTTHTRTCVLFAALPAPHTYRTARHHLALHLPACHSLSPNAHLFYSLWPAYSACGAAHAARVAYHASGRTSLWYTVLSGGRAPYHAGAPYRCAVRRVPAGAATLARWFRRCVAQHARAWRTWNISWV